jgi:hypothetical protein
MMRRGFSENARQSDATLLTARQLVEQRSRWAAGNPTEAKISSISVSCSARLSVVGG